ncbi:TetR family transcriptional regulator [Mycolicibacterium sp. CBMA 234]|uniref:TetR/AcrR family transcriptional regulator n=1 Tax=Mycolicibacterium sp. CBMA 234 TaxID=1918495 RepID=UPI001390CF53|nr:TetR family transcriptional regulator [Mycolicibacterium sp. CBMA 234]
MPHAFPDEIRRRRRPAELRRTLIATSRRLFAEQGYQATTQKQIASIAGISTSVLFRNFGSKAQLFVDVVFEPFGDFGSDLLAIYSAAPATVDGVPERQFIVGIVERLQPHRAILRSLLSALQSPDGDVLMEAMGRRIDVLISEVASTVSQSAPGRWRIEEQSEVVLRLAIGMVTLMIALDDWLLPAGLSVDDDRLIEILASMVALDGSISPSNRRGPRARRAHGAPMRVSPAVAAEQPRRHSDEVRSALLVAATTLFRENGFSATGYRDIALSAGTSESVLYRHFGSKSNLLAEAALQPFTDSFQAASRRWTAMTPEARRARQPQVIAELYSTFVANRHLVRVLMGLAHDPTHADLNALTARRFEQSFTTLGALSVERARAEQVTPYEPELRIRSVVAMVLAAAVLDDWFFTRGDEVLAGSRVVAAMSALVDRGRVVQ